MTAERWTTDADLAAARERFAAQVPGYRPPVAYALARRDPAGLVLGHVNRLGAARGLPAAALAVRCGYRGTSGGFAMTAEQVAQVLEDLAPAEAATHVPHPNIWSWRELLAGAAPGTGFVALFLADEHDAPATAEEAQLLARAQPDA